MLEASYRSIVKRYRFNVRIEPASADIVGADTVNLTERFQLALPLEQGRCEEQHFLAPGALLWRLK